MSTFPPPVAALLNRFRRQRPLRGGSLLVTIFGDAIVPRGSAISLSSLISLAAPFGLSERLVRTAMSRLAKEGWVEARRTGKLSEYRLTPAGAQRFAEATLRIYSPPEVPATGSWTMVLLPGVTARRRQRFRQDLAWLGFGELASGVFAHPDFSVHAARQAGLPKEALVFEAVPDAGSAPAQLVTLGWDLQELGKRYVRFSERFAPIRELVRAQAIDSEAAFVVRTLLIHEYRRLHLRDPLLPKTLLPGGWPGTRAAELCREIYLDVFESAEKHLSRAATRLDGPLPALERAVYQRFGGFGSF